MLRFFVHPEGSFFGPDGMPCAVLRRPEALDCRVRVPPETWSGLTRNPPCLGSEPQTSCIREPILSQPRHRPEEQSPNLSTQGVSECVCKDIADVCFNVEINIHNSFASSLLVDFNVETQIRTMFAFPLRELAKTLRLLVFNRLCYFDIVV